VLADVNRVHLTGNVIDGGWAGIALGSETAALLSGNRIDASSTPMTVAGEAARPESPADVIGRVFRWNPVLVLWVAILGVPMVVGAWGILGAINRRRASAPAS
jgi:hypothetical protein